MPLARHPASEEEQAGRQHREPRAEGGPVLAVLLRRGAGKMRHGRAGAVLRAVTASEAIRGASLAPGMSLSGRLSNLHPSRRRFSDTNSDSRGF